MTGSNRYSERLRSHHDALSPLRACLKPVSNLAERLQELPLDGRPRTVYIHVPFCTHSCTFCNLSRRRAQPPDDYADLILRELETYTAYPYVSAGRYGAVYFGGGTPTTLSPQALRKILKALRTELDLAPDAEVTVETTVSDLTEDKVAVFQEEGVNRFSIGVQTFSEKGRRLLGRLGTGKQAIEMITTLLREGFQNVGIDLIYNWPGQSEDDLREDLEIIESLDLAGLSFYALILVEGAALDRMISAGHCPPMGSLARERVLFDLILERLLDRGFILHELTKLVKPGRDEYRYVRIRHQGGDTLALGAGAGGRLGQLMYRNPPDLSAYRAQVEGPTGLPSQGFLADRRYALGYRIVGRLQFGRLEWALLDSAPEIGDGLRPLIEALKEDGLVRIGPHGLSLTTEGIFWGNNIGQEFAMALVKLFKGGDVTGHPHTSVLQKVRKSDRHPLLG